MNCNLTTRQESWGEWKHVCSQCGKEYTTSTQRYQVECFGPAPIKEVIIVPEESIPEPQPEPEMPVLTSRLATFGKAAISHFLKGSPTCSQEQIDERAKICLSCPFFAHQTGSATPGEGYCMHEGCGCNISTNMKYLNKLAWADQQCPDGKWGTVTPE